jgi:hypothetical protein
MLIDATVYWTCVFLVITVLINSVDGFKHNGQDVASKAEFDYFRRCGELFPGCVFTNISMKELSYSNLITALREYSPSHGQVEKKTMFIGLQFLEQPKDFEAMNLFLAEHPAFHLQYLLSPTEDGFNNYWIILRLIPNYLLSILTTFTSYYFPTQETCSSRPLTVNMDKWSTWGNGYFTLSNHQTSFPETIFSVFVSDHCKHHSGNRFIHRKRCSERLNKFDCLFLPSTNCSLPKLITDCELSENFRNDFYYFTNATVDGQEIPNEKMNEYRQSLLDHNKLTSIPLLNELLQQHSYQPFPYKNYEINNVDFIFPETLSVSIRDDGFPHEDKFAGIYMYGIHFRENIHFRSKIQEVVQRTRLSSHFGLLRPEEQCVVVHMRKDDRMIKGLEGSMGDWCRNHTDFTVKDREESATGDYQGAPLQSGTWMDFGCLHHLPYGDASLEHFLNATLAMFPENKNIFIMTDDPSWLDYHVERIFGVTNISVYSSDSLSLEKDRTYGRTQFVQTKTKDPRYSKLRLFPLASKRIPETPPFDLYESNVEFWASIELARQCQGLVYHPGSAVARMISSAMCYRSRGIEYLQCPDLFDISGKEIIFPYQLEEQQRNKNI